VGLALALGVAAPYENLIISGSPMSFDYSTPAAVFLFLLFLLVQPAMGRRRLTRTELAVVYIMAMVACTLPTNGLVSVLLSQISAGTYYATPENGWAKVISDYVRPWMIISDQEAVKTFYEGLSRGKPVPWTAWVIPLLRWLPLLLGMYAVVVAVMVFVRKQWISNERLLFPLVQVPIAMIGEQEGRISPFFRNPTVWLGFLVPMLMNSWRALHHYFPVVPEGFPLWKYYWFWRRSFFIRLSVSYAVVGFGYLLDTRTGFSIWALGLLTTFEYAVFRRFGISSPRRVMADPLGSPFLAHQGLGAMLALAGLAIWTARGHLGKVLRKVLANEPGVDDSGEIISYRGAALLLLAGLVTMSVWLRFSGMSWWVVPMFLLLTFSIMFGLARIVAQGGLAVTRSPMLPGDAVLSFTGSSSLGPANVASLGMTFPWANEMRTTVMSAFAHALKLAEVHIAPRQRRRLGFPVLLAVLTSIAGAVATILVLGYRYGGVNLSFWFFGVRSAGMPYDFMSYYISNPGGPELACLAFVGAGALVQLALTAMYHRFLWWPINPLVFPVAAMWCTHHLMPSIFVAWLCKVLVLKYGGARWYRRTKPFFLGMILGQYASGGMWIVIDGFTGMQGNYLFFW